MKESATLMVGFWNWVWFRFSMSVQRLMKTGSMLCSLAAFVKMALMVFHRESQLREYYEWDWNSAGTLTHTGMFAVTNSGQNAASDMINEQAGTEKR